MISMFKVFVDQLRRILHDRVYISLLTILPAISLLFFACFFSDVSIESLPIVVVDNDHSATSRELVEMIDATASVDVRYSAQSVHESQTIITSGRAYAVVVIPHNFERSILRQEPCSIILYNSGANISTNGFIEKDLQRVATTFNAAISLERGENLAQILPVQFEQHILFNAELDYAAYLAPCFMPMMIMIFSLLGSVMAVTDCKIGSVRELIARCLPTTIAMILFAVLMLVLLFVWLKIPLNGSVWVIIIATILLIADYQAIGVSLAALTKNRDLAISLGGGYSVLAFTFSGLTFPTMAMFPILRFASYLFPFTYYMTIMVEQALRGAAIEISLPNIGCMLLFLLLPMVIYKRL